MSQLTHSVESMVKRYLADPLAGKQLVVFSHLRWEFVKQRPQHLLERLGQKVEVIFVEEPIAYSDLDYGTARVFSPAEGVTVIQPRIDAGDFPSLAYTLYTYTDLDRESEPMLWFYSASFVEMASLIPHSLVIYDCMDELSQFRGAPKELLNQEKRLLSISNLVFTGGKSLYESKKRFHDAVYCFPSSVDRKHFAKAQTLSSDLPKDLAKIPGPVVGFYGVIDERLDLELLSKVAKKLPEVSFAMIGPVVKISEADLPKAKNIYYLGNKNYAELPDYLQGFDVAFMPFALNEATEFISPTKTLEFMAAFKPIVSTPIYDVKRDYEKEVRIVASAKEMATAIMGYLHETTAEQKERVALQKAVLDKTSWDKTAKKMESLIKTKLTELAEQTDELTSYKLNPTYRMSV